jgi:hypothetical protein
MKRWKVPFGACAFAATLTLGSLPAASASAASHAALAPRATSPVDGSEDTTFTSDITGVDQLAVQPDGKILVGGDITQWNGSAVPRGLVRLNFGSER